MTNEQFVKEDKRGSLIGFGIAALIIISVLVFACSQGGGANREPSTYEYRELLKDALKDPGSAQFKDEVLYKQKSGTYVLCGRVNAKNSFGGYTGYTRFIAGGTLAIVESDDTSGVFSGLWLEVCQYH